MHGHTVLTVGYRGLNPSTNEIEEATVLEAVMVDGQPNLLVRFSNDEEAHAPIQPAKKFQLVAGEGSSLVYRGISMGTFEEEDAPVTGVAIVKTGVTEKPCLAVKFSTEDALVPIKPVGEFELYGLAA
jgi:hypothetical protein